MPPPPDMAFWLGRKYAILGKTAEGEYQRNIAEAGKTRAETGEVAPNAASMRALQAAQSGLYGAEAADVTANIYPSEDFWRQVYRRGLGLGSQGSQQPEPTWHPPMALSSTAPVAIQRGTQAPQIYQVPRSTDPLLDTSPGKALPNIRPLGSLADPNTRGSQGGGSVPDSNQSPMYRMGPQGPEQFRKGTANVKAKGGKGSKSGGKGGSGAPQGLEQILPALMAASQASQLGGGAVGPQAADSSEPPMAPGAAAPATQPPGMRRGMTNVMGYQEGTQDVAPSGGGNPIHIHILSGFGSNPSPASEPAAASSGGNELTARTGATDVKAPAKKSNGKGNGKAKSKAPAKPSGDLHRGLAAILPQLLAAAQQGGGGPPGAPPMAPGGSAPPAPPQPPGMAMGAADVQGYQGGTSNVDPTGLGSQYQYTASGPVANQADRAYQAAIDFQRTEEARNAPRGSPVDPQIDQIFAPYRAALDSLGKLTDTLGALNQQQGNIYRRNPGIMSADAEHLRDLQEGLLTGRITPDHPMVQQALQPQSPGGQLGSASLVGGRGMPKFMNSTFDPRYNPPVVPQGGAQTTRDYYWNMYSPEAWPQARRRPGFAVGAPDVLGSGQSAPGYPFGAGYLFGATAVPGQGSGTVDKVPAMLAPHEAVLNRAAADMMGRGRIAALNAAGAKQMGLNRGAR